MSGFTIIEMLVVMAIIALVAALSMQGLKTLLAAQRVQTGLQAVSTALTVTRAYVGAGSGTGYGRGGYEGVALLFTPANLRIVKHVSEDPDGTALENGSGGTLDPQYDAFADIPETEYIEFPAGAGVVGIARPDDPGTNKINELLLLTPPFAVRFNENGQIISRRGAPVYYDGDYDGQYTTSEDRFAYDPARPNEPHYSPVPYDPDSTDFDKDNYSEKKNKYLVPIEKIPTVIGVIVYNKEALVEKAYKSGSTPADFLRATTDGGKLKNAAEKWLLTQVRESGGLNQGEGGAQAILFNRYTGALVREE